MELLLTPEPHFIPGYSGQCPQYLYRNGDTYGTITHKLLIDPCVSHAENLIVSNRSMDEFGIRRPTLAEIDIVKNHEKLGDAIFQHPMTPGYEGFIPNKYSKVGQRFGVTATEAIADQEKLMLKLRCEARKMKHRTALQEKNIFLRSVAERSFKTDNYRLPLEAVRPEAQGILRKRENIPESPPLPYSRSTPPHFMKNDDPQKYITKGYMGHIPVENQHFGECQKLITNSALVDFTNNYQHKQSTEWAPITNNLSPPPKSIKDEFGIFDIYPKNSGLTPNYAGHIPGMAYRFGTTFAKATVDVKKYLRE